MTARRGAERGFTLLEVIVAMALFAAGIVAVFQLYSGALRLAAESRDASAASIYARQRMEEALLVPAPVDGVEGGAFGDRYRWEVATSVAPQEGETPYDEVRVRVTVSWKDGGDERAVYLSANRWKWREGGGVDLSAGSARDPSSSASASGGLPGAGGGGDGEDYLRAPVGRRRR